MRNQMKDTIAEAFIELAKKKDIDKITVKNLVDYCGISRQSFYYHFQDIFEVIEWYNKRLEERITAKCQEAGSLEEAVRILVHSFMENKDLIERFQDSQKRRIVEMLVVDALQERLRETARDAVADGQVQMSSSDAEAVLRFTRFGIGGLLVTYSRGKDRNEEELIRQIIMVVTRMIPRLGEK